MVLLEHLKIDFPIKITFCDHRPGSFTFLLKSLKDRIETRQSKPVWCNKTKSVQSR